MGEGQDGNRNASIHPSPASIARRWPRARSRRGASSAIARARAATRRIGRRDRVADGHMDLRRASGVGEQLRREVRGSRLVAYASEPDGDGAARPAHSTIRGGARDQSRRERAPTAARRRATPPAIR